MPKHELSRIEMTQERALLERTARQSLLEPAEIKDLARIVRVLCGVNAQQGNAMMLSLRARVSGLEREHVRSELEAGGGLVRAWAFRGTMHLMDPEDVRRFLPVLGPTFIARSAGRYRDLGLTAETLNESLSAVPEVLSASGALTRYELADALAERGLSIDRKGQALIHLIRFVALNGLICIGPDNPRGEPTYVPLDPPATPEDAGGGSGLAPLALRYLDGYGPADARDFAAWCGVGLARSGKAWEALHDEGSILEARVDGRALSLPAPGHGSDLDKDSGRQAVRLLPAFDAYVLGYADRELIVPGERNADVYHGGQTVPVVLVNGRAAGTWRYERSGRRMRIEARAFESITGTVRSGISAEADDIGRLFDTPVTLEVKTP